MDTKKIFDAVINGNIQETQDGVNEALAANVPADQILNEALIPAMTEVGCLFEAQEFYVPEMLVSAKAMQSGLKTLKPLLASQAGPSSGQTSPKAVFGTVKGDLHDIGKDLVIMMLEGAGFQVTDLGVDVPPEKFVQAVHDGAQLIGLSAMLTTTMLNMKTTIDALKEAGARDKVKVIVGGAPLTQSYADHIGADGFAKDASSAVRKAKELITALEAIHD
ncbi:MAG TPA: corrinoid protein [Anaerolineales bacterium]|nr:corrinoid protein [Anaerolineales bacterium]